MSLQGSVTRWIDPLKAGAAEAVEQLMQRYFCRLVELARLKLRGATFGVADEWDLAQCAFDSFCRGAKEGRFPRLDDRDDLWQLLALLTARKASNLRRDENRQPCGGHAPNQKDLDLEQLIGREPSPEFAAEWADTCRHLLTALGDDTLRAVALAKMEGYTNEEIAKTLQYSPRTVERKLGLIRNIWEEDKP